MAKLLGHDVVTAAELETFAKDVEAKIEARAVAVETAVEAKFKNHKYYLIGAGALLVIAIVVHFLH